MNDLPTLLCVDDEPHILTSLERLLRGRQMRVLTADSGPRALELLASEPIDVLLSDMRMPGMDGAELLEAASVRWPDTVRLLLTGHADQRDTVRAINAGKVFGYLSKPWEPQALIAAIDGAAQHAQLTRTKLLLEAENQAQRAALETLNTFLELRVDERTAEVEQAHARLKRNYMMSIKVFANLIELRGGRLLGHGRRVADLARSMAVVLGCDDEAVQAIFVAGLLHDIGLIGLPDFALARPVETLDADQQALHRRHTTLGEQSLLALDDLQPAAALIRSHHERFDGKGYPDGTAGDRIELGARILAVADSFDELVSGAHGLPCLMPDVARERLFAGRGTLFDPLACDALLQVTKPAASIAKPARASVVGWAWLEVGMELAADLRSPEGALLLAADHVLGAPMIERIHRVARRGAMRLELQIKSESISRARAGA